MKKLCMLICVLYVSACYAPDSLRLFNSMGNYFSANKSPNSLKISKGDTLYSISRKYKVPIRDIIETNNIKSPYALYTGQTIKMPKAKYHVVKKGDTVYNVAKRYNIEMSKLTAANNLKSPFTLSIDQKLLLPGAMVSVKNTQTTSSESKNVSKTKKQTTKKTNYQPSDGVKPAKYRKSKFVWPVRGTVISDFGPIAKGRNNDGINIKAPLGTAVKAADKGIVAYAGNELKGFGNLILIKHSDGWITAYAHNDQMFVKKGQRIIKGEKIATVGKSGSVNTPQLHFEVRAGKKAYNPLKYLP